MKPTIEQIINYNRYSLKKLLSTVLLLFTVVACFAQTGKTKKFAVFPREFKLQPGEVPAGFVTRPIDQEAKSMGITSNPAVVNNTNIISNVYDGINVNAVTAVMMSMYVKPNHEQELGVYIIEYKSDQLLKTELKKLTPAPGKKYYRKGNYLFMIWSDAGSYTQQVNTMAERLKTRLKLTEVK